MKVSVIVPVAADEDEAMRRRPLEWQLPDGWQLIIAAAPNTSPPPGVDDKARWLVCPREGRAAQMNAAAEVAENEWLWFVHADSVITADACDKLRAAIGDYPAADKNITPPVLYFDLRFVDGGMKMRINELGVRLRCALFGNPFGDQALCLTRGVWKLAGGYDETADYGEDHLLVLRAQKKGVKLRRIAAKVGTSARRYEVDGWWRTMSLYRSLWIKQYREELGR